MVVESPRSDSENSPASYLAAHRCHRPAGLRRLFHFSFHCDWGQGEGASSSAGPSSSPAGLSRGAPFPGGSRSRNKAQTKHQRLGATATSMDPCIALAAITSWSWMVRKGTHLSQESVCHGTLQVGHCPSSWRPQLSYLRGLMALGSDSHTYGAGSSGRG